eukprot:SAG11_NODE_3125_length_2668_cov_2.885948_2_plen_130_part_00
MGQKLTAKKMAKAFKQIDTDGGGQIEFAELLMWWKKQKKKKLGDFETKLAAAGSSDDEGATSEGATAAVAKDAEEERLRAVWDILDSDANGSLNKVEVKRVFETMGRKLNGKKFEKAFVAMDSDGGGRD